MALFVTRVSRGRTIREVILAMLLDQLPAGRMVMTFFLLVMAIFLAAHMDAVGYAVSATCTRDLAEGEDPAPSDRLFWCIMLTLVPLAMIFSKAPLNTMKTAVIVTAIPFLVVLLLKAYGLLKWLREDYGNVPGHLIEERHGSAGTVVVNKQPVG